MQDVAAHHLRRQGLFGIDPHRWSPTALADPDVTIRTWSNVVSFTGVLSAVADDAHHVSICGLEGWLYLAAVRDGHSRGG